MRNLWKRRGDRDIDRDRYRNDMEWNVTVYKVSQLKIVINDFNR